MKLAKTSWIGCGSDAVIGTDGIVVGVLSPGDCTRLWRGAVAALATGAVFVVTGCGGGSSSVSATGGTIQLRSPAFAPGAMIPTRYTCDGADLAPPLSWSRVPAHAAQLALTLEDLDAAGHPFTHWAIAGLGSGAKGISEAAPPPGAVQGRNDFGRVGYGGPCPPRGQRHRYRFVVYALRAPLALVPGFRLSDEGTAIAKDTLAVGELVGVYKRG
jgi:Raf kinase inhibitor-like YbhB/YbcL family protein